MTAVSSHAFHIENVFPSVDCGRFPVKRIVGETVEVWADIYRDGHDVITADLIWRREPDTDWQRTPMFHDGNDRCQFQNSSKHYRDIPFSSLHLSLLNGKIGRFCCGET